MAKAFVHKFWTSDDGLKLHYRDYPGPGESARLPVLCLHGLTRNARDFAAIAETISHQRRVIVPEMRGRGRSDYAADHKSYHPRQYISDVEKLLGELEIDRFALIGTSMGGLMAMLMAAQSASRFAGFVLNDVGPDLNAEGITRIAQYVGQGKSYSSWLHAARALRSVHGQAFPDYALDDWLEMAKRTLIVGQNGRISYDYDLAIAEGFAEANAGEPADLWPFFEALKQVPGVLVRGEISDLLSAETARKMRARHPDLELVNVPRMGHAPMLDEAEAVSAILALLERVP